MNPNNTPSPGFELPSPVGGDTASAPEQAPMPETAHDPSPTPPSAQPMQPVAQTSNPVTPPMNVPMNPATAGVPLAADDADLIEKEWVEKAKAIVASTRHDPRTQNRELNKFKADYMQKRYNKTLKVDES
jgi:hypothetical protein